MPTRHGGSFWKKATMYRRFNLRRMTTFPSSRSHGPCPLRTRRQYDVDYQELIPPFPIDDIAKRAAIEIGAQIFAEHVDPSVAVLVAGGRDMRRDQYPRIGPHSCRW